MERVYNKSWEGNKNKTTNEKKSISIDETLDSKYSEEKCLNVFHQLFLGCKTFHIFCSI
jgi:hypothetical protein